MVASLSALAIRRSQRPLGAIVIGRAGLDLYPEPDGTEIEVQSAMLSEDGRSMNICIVPDILLNSMDVCTDCCVCSPISE